MSLTSVNDNNTRQTFPFKNFFAAAIAILLLFSPLKKAGASLAIKSGSNQVDGINNNPRVVVKTPLSGTRSPVFSWEISGSEAVTSFILVVSTRSSDFSSPYIWLLNGSTSSANTTRYSSFDLIKETYGGTAALEVGTTYYWKIECYGERGSTATATGNFYTIEASQTPASPTIDLKIDYNNPLKPGNYTRIVAAAFDRDRTLKLRIFNITGEKLVRDWTPFIVPKNGFYVIEWDGTDINGERLPRGVYLVNLYDENDKSRVTRRLAITER